MQFFDEGHGYDRFGMRVRVVSTVARLVKPLYERYFRVISHGAEHVPAEGGAIVIANHGGALPVDAALLFEDVVLRTPRTPRIIAAHFVPRLPVVSTLLARIGVVSGSPANVRCLLERGELVVVFPEGVSGPAKPFRDRYRLQSWRVGFAELALRYRVPVVPVAIVGAEESWPVVLRLPLAHAFGAPYIPVPLSPLPLPARVRITYGAPLHLHRGHAAEDADDPEVVHEAAARARTAVEHLLVTELASRPAVFR